MVGRPATGIRPGGRIQDYPRFTVRLPDDVRAELDAAAGALQLPAWRVMVDAIRAYIGSGDPLTDEQRKAIRVVQKLHEK